MVKAARATRAVGRGRGVGRKVGAQVAVRVATTGPWAKVKAIKAENCGGAVKAAVPMVMREASWEVVMVRVVTGEGAIAWAVRGRAAAAVMVLEVGLGRAAAAEMVLERVAMKEEATVAGTGVVE